MKLTQRMIVSSWPKSITQIPTRRRMPEKSLYRSKKHTRFCPMNKSESSMINSASVLKVNSTQLTQNAQLLRGIFIRTGAGAPGAGGAGPGGFHGSGFPGGFDPNDIFSQFFGGGFGGAGAGMGGDAFRNVAGEDIQVIRLNVRQSMRRTCAKVPRKRNRLH